MSDRNHSLPFLNKVVWITGASSGIGEALSYQLAQLGAHLILSARGEEELNLVNKQLPRNPGSAKILPLDLEDLGQLPQKNGPGLGIFWQNRLFHQQCWTGHSRLRLDYGVAH